MNRVHADRRYFANKLREGLKIATVGQVVPTSGVDKPPPYKHCTGAVGGFVTAMAILANTLQ